MLVMAFPFFMTVLFVFMKIMLVMVIISVKMRPMMRTIMFHVMFVIPGAFHEIHRSCARIISAAILSPMLSVLQGDCKINRAYARYRSANRNHRTAVPNLRYDALDR